VIDDDAGIRVLVTRILERNDFQVDVARDGAEGIEKLSATDYGVIVLDLMMPRLDGVAVVKYLSQYAPEKIPSVIVTSAFGAAAFDKVCPPVHRFLEKPFDVTQLVAQAIDCCRANVS